MYALFMLCGFWVALSLLAGVCMAIRGLCGRPYSRSIDIETTYNLMDT